MNRNWISAVAVLALCAAIAGTVWAAPQDQQDGTKDHPSHSATGEYQWVLPQGFPQPRVPADNPMSEAKVKLGRYLFYDLRLSGNGSQSCASCHQQSLAFTD